MKFDRLGIFTYSHEENTHAYNFEDNVPPKLKKERADSIMDLQSGISFELNAEKIGKEYKVLIDRAEDGYFIGRSEYDSPEVDNEVLIEKNEHTYCRIGDFVKVKITKSDHYDLYGELVG
jgi:ribosomal protein S12 methylthiotransferase